MIDQNKWSVFSFVDLENMKLYLDSSFIGEHELLKYFSKATGSHWTEKEPEEEGPWQWPPICIALLPQGSKGQTWCSYGNSAETAAGEEQCLGKGEEGQEKYEGSSRGAQRQEPYKWRTEGQTRMLLR